MWIGHHFQGQKVKGQLVADVLNSQHAGTGATWRINAKILSTCRGRRHIVSPRAQLVTSAKEIVFAFVCLCVCLRDNSESCGRMLVKMAWLKLVKHAPPICVICHAEFGRSRSNNTSIIKEILLTFHSDHEPISYTVSEINGDFNRKSQIFPISVYFAPPLKGFPSNWVLSLRVRKLDWWGYRAEQEIWQYLQPLISNYLTNHCLHPLLPSDKTLSHMLRARGHAFQLPTCTYNLHKNHLSLNKMFTFLAWLCFSCLILSTIAVLPLSILYFDIYICYMFNKLFTYLLTPRDRRTDGQTLADSNNHAYA